MMFLDKRQDMLLTKIEPNSFLTTDQTWLNTQDKKLRENVNVKIASVP